MKLRGPNDESNLCVLRESNGVLDLLILGWRVLQGRQDRPVPRKKMSEVVYLDERIFHLR